MTNRKENSIPFPAVCLQSITEKTMRQSRWKKVESISFDRQGTEVSDKGEQRVVPYIWNEDPLEVTLVTTIPILSCLELVNFSLSYTFYHDIPINPIFFCVHLLSYRNFEDENFCQVGRLQHPVPGIRTQMRVPKFLDRIVQFSSSICFWVVITYVIVYRIWILRPRVSSDPDREPDTSLQSDLTFLVVRFD